MASKCDIGNVLVALNVHAGLRSGRNNVGKRMGFLLILRIVLLSL